MASRRWAASLDNCSNSLVAEVKLSWVNLASLSTGGLPTCLSHGIVILSCGRSLGDRLRELPTGLLPYVKEGLSRKVPAQPTGMHTRSTAPHSSRSLASSGAYLPAFSFLLMWRLRSAQKPTSIRSKEHARLSTSAPGDGEGIMFGTHFACIRSGATPCPASIP